MDLGKFIEAIFEHGNSLTSILFIVGITTIALSFLIYLTTIGIIPFGKVENLNKNKAYKLSKVLLIISIFSILAGIILTSLSEKSLPEDKPSNEYVNCREKQSVKSTLELIRNMLDRKSILSTSSTVILESYENQFKKYLNEKDFCEDKKMINDSTKEINYIEKYIRSIS